MISPWDIGSYVGFPLKQRVGADVEGRSCARLTSTAGHEEAYSLDTRHNLLVAVTKSPGPG